LAEDDETLFLAGYVISAIRTKGRCKMVSEPAPIIAGAMSFQKGLRGAAQRFCIDSIVEHTLTLPLEYRQIDKAQGVLEKSAEEKWFFRLEKVMTDECWQWLYRRGLVGRHKGSKDPVFTIRFGKAQSLGLRSGPKRCRKTG
jgi:hypothetical protein